MSLLHYLTYFLIQKEFFQLTPLQNAYQFLPLQDWAMRQEYYAIYLGKELVYSASLFDRKHTRDSTKLKLICGEADEVGKIVAALLKEKPNKDREKALKKLQDDIKTTLRGA